MPRPRKSKPHQDTRTHTHACTILNQNLIRSALKKRPVEQPQCRVGQGGEGTQEHRQTHTCARKHTQTDVPVHRHTHTLLCVWSRRYSSVCARLHVSADLWPLSKFNSHMETGKTHTCRPKSCCRCQDGVTRSRVTASGRLRRPGVWGGRQGCLTPRRDTGPQVGRIDGSRRGL